MIGPLGRLGAAATLGQHHPQMTQKRCTGFSSEIGTKLRDWAIGQAGGSCYSRAALSSNGSKTRYTGLALERQPQSTEILVCERSFICSIISSTRLSPSVQV